MKIKRINENKIQIIISNEDLERKQVKKWDLMPNSPRAQELFQDMLEKAYTECGFEVDSDSQLMVEAYPMTPESLVVIVTKLKHKEKRHSKDKNLLFRSSEEMMEEIEDFEDYISEIEDDEDEDLSIYVSKDLVYAFKDFEHVVQLSKILAPYFKGTSSLYKYKQKYYLVFDKAERIPESQKILIGEYGELKKFDRCYLNEHGKLLTEDIVIDVFSKL